MKITVTLVDGSQVTVNSDDVLYNYEQNPYYLAAYNSKGDAENWAKISKAVEIVNRL